MRNSQKTFIEGIGNTPLIKLKAASEITGCNIYGKAEYLNPGGSVKDRAALALIKDAEEKKLISKGGTIVEGTAGNTGIGLCLLGNSLGYKTIIVMIAFFILFEITINSTIKQINKKIDIFNKKIKKKIYTISAIKHKGLTAIKKVLVSYVH